MKKYLGSFANRESFVQAIKVGLVGLINTIVSFAIFNVFLMLRFGWFPSFTIAFALTTFMSHVINRRWTFDLKDGKVSGSETMRFFAINIAAYVASALIMWIADQVFGPLTTLGYNVALIVAGGLLILPKLAGYRDLVFSKALAGEGGPGTTEAEASRVPETPLT